MRSRVAPAASARARTLLEATTIGAGITIGHDSLGVTLPAGTPRDVVAEVNRVLVEGGISVYRLQPVHLLARQQLS